MLFHFTLILICVSIKHLRLLLLIFSRSSYEIFKILHNNEVFMWNSMLFTIKIVNYLSQNSIHTFQSTLEYNQIPMLESVLVGFNTRWKVVFFKSNILLMYGFITHHIKSVVSIFVIFETKKNWNWLLLSEGTIWFSIKLLLKIVKICIFDQIIGSFFMDLRLLITNT